MFQLPIRAFKIDKRLFEALVIILIDIWKKK